MRSLRLVCVFVPAVMGVLLPASASAAERAYHWDKALTAVSCPSANFCAAVGTASRPNSGPPPEIFKAIARMWNGKAWRTVRVPGNPKGQSSLTDVSCTSARFCMAVGRGNGQATISERWNGTSWSLVRSKHATQPRHEGLLKVDCPAPNRCFSVGPIYHQGRTYGLTEQWDGKSWRLLGKAWDPNWPLEPTGLACPSIHRCLEVGYVVHGQAPHEVWKAAAAVWHPDTDDHWTRVRVPASKSSDLWDISCVSARDCRAVGVSFATASGKPLLEYWDGARWHQRAARAIAEISCTARKQCVGMTDGSPTTHVFTASGWHSERFADADSSHLNNLDCVSARKCFAVGSVQNGNGHSSTLIEFRGHGWRVSPSP